MRVDKLEVALWVGLIATGLIVVLCIVAAIVDTVNWHKYKEAAHCAPTGKQYVENSLTSTVTSSGSVVVIPTTTVKNEWRCDGGVFVWR